MIGIRKFVFWAAAMAVVSLGRTADADILYSNLTETTDGTNVLSTETYGPSADSFSTGADAATLTTVVMLLKTGNPSDGQSFFVQLRSNGSNEPGTLLASVTGYDSNLTTTLAEYTFDFGSYALAADTRYWIVGTGAGSQAKWGYTESDDGTGVSGEYNARGATVYSNSSGSAEVYQMQVNGSTVPEPGSLVLGAIGLGVLAIARLYAMPVQAGSV